MTLIPFACPSCGPRLDTFPSSTVWCACGKKCAPDLNAWLEANLTEQRTRSDLERLAAQAGLAWTKVSAAAKEAGVRRVTRNGQSVWRVVPETCV